SAGLQNARQDADRAIHFQVDKLNETLAQVETLNNRIMSAARLGRDASSLMDQRQKAIDTIAEAIPLRSVARDNGGVALFSTGGVALLDGRAATLAFAPTPIILPHMTQENGLLSGLSINGKSVNMSVNGPMSGGSLGARFQVRDQETVLLQAQLDGVARDVIERLGPGGPDSSIAVSDPGLFMDAGSAFLATEEIGISGRITLNPLAARDGGETWRLRDGLGAAGPGEVGQAGLLNALYATLTDAVLPSSASLAPTSQSVAERASDWSSAIGAFRVRQDAQLSFAQAQNVALSELVLAEGVDSDQELQFLILLEQSFQANAKVMTTVDDMIQTVLAI
ncbi:FlgK family flagellar hook-associated protein, partial [Puniceibacterium confluentis]|uniref:FlgK family flagellar hook-associated protein n=1 Tax=Puniceibacterium confluentis TaxID=1958944 RepID=UPI003569C482